MKWAQVAGAALAVIEADADLVAVYGTNLRLANDADALVAPLLEYSVIGDGTSELWAPVVLQFDQWTTTLDDLIRSELRLHRLFHREGYEPLGGLSVWAQYVDGDTLAAPSRDGYFGRAARFRFTPLRDRYSPSPTP